MRNLACFVAGFGVALVVIAGNSSVWAQSREVVVLQGSVRLLVDGSNFGSDTLLYNGSTYVPLRTVSEALGFNVSFHEPSNTAIISTNSEIAFLEHFPDIPTFESVTGISNINILENDVNRLRFTVSKQASTEYEFLQFVARLTSLGFTNYIQNPASGTLQPWADNNEWPSTLILSRGNEQIIISMSGAFYTFSILRI